MAGVDFISDAHSLILLLSTKICSVNETWLIKVIRVTGEWVNLYLLCIPLCRSKILWSGLFSKETGMCSDHMPF